MVRSFRFLLNFAWLNMGAVIGFAAIVIGGCYATGVPTSTGSSGGDNLFATYYAMFPIMILFVLYICAFSLCTSHLNLGLSFGARRGDFFGALQGIMGFYTLVSWVLQIFMCAFPSVANWQVRNRWALLRMFDSRPWLFPLSCAIFMILGCLSGLITIKHKGLGVFLMTVSVLALMGATIFLILSAETDLMDFLREDPQWAWVAALPRIIAGVLAAAAAGGELIIWRTIQRFTVR